MKITCGFLLVFAACAALTPVLIIVSLTALGDNLDALFSQLSTAVDSAAQEPAPPPPAPG